MMIISYRYGFNGKEKDDEVKGPGNQIDYGFRVQDPRLGRFLSVDPLTKTYPWYSPYQYAGNTPIQSIDIDGLEPGYWQNGTWIPASDQFSNNAPTNASFIPPVQQARSVVLDLYTDEKIAAARTYDFRSNPSSGALTPVYPELIILAGPAIKTGSKIADIAVDALVNPFGRTSASKGAVGKIATEHSFSPNFVVDKGGQTFPVPKGAVGPTPVINNSGKQTGVAFTGGKGGDNGKVNSIRIMDPVPARGKSPARPNGYIKYENSASPTPQGVNPYSGKTGSQTETHFDLKSKE